MSGSWRVCAPSAALCAPLPTGLLCYPTPAQLGLPACYLRVRSKTFTPLLEACDAGDSKAAQQLLIHLLTGGSLVRSHGFHALYTLCAAAPRQA